MPENQHHEVCVRKADHLHRKRVVRESLFSFTKEEENTPQSNCFGIISLQKEPNKDTHQVPLVQVLRTHQTIIIYPHHFLVLKLINLTA